jgi:hypothetical protein
VEAINTTLTNQFSTKARKQATAPDDDAHCILSISSHCVCADNRLLPLLLQNAAQHTCLHQQPNAFATAAAAAAAAAASSAAVPLLLSMLPVLLLQRRQEGPPDPAQLPQT